MHIRKSLLAGVAILGIGIMAVTGCHPRPPFHKADFPDRVVKRMDKMAEEFKLNDVQRQKYNELREFVKTQLGAMREYHKQTMQAVDRELSQAKPDANKIAALVKKGHADRPERFNELVDKTVALYNSLDDTQKARVVEKLKKYHRCFGRP